MTNMKSNSNTFNLPMPKAHEEFFKSRSKLSTLPRFKGSIHSNTIQRAYSNQSSGTMSYLGKV